MHRVVAIDEIFRSFLLYVASKSTLRSLALSCHAFYNPAMDSLWYRLEGLRPLVDLLPEDARGTEDNESSYGVVCHPFRKLSLLLSADRYNHAADHCQTAGHG